MLPSAGIDKIPSCANLIFSVAASELPSLNTISVWLLSAAKVLSASASIDAAVAIASVPSLSPAVKVILPITSPSASSPGDVYANYVDVQLQCPAYMYFQVEVEAYASAYSTDVSSLASDQYALHS